MSYLKKLGLVAALSALAGFLAMSTLPALSAGLGSSNPPANLASIPGTLAVAKGGTGSTTASGARTNLGVTYPATGTFTPTFVGSSGGAAGSYLAQQGNYIHMLLSDGTYMTHLEIYIRGNAGTLAGSIEVGGFTFTPIAASATQGGCAISWYQGWTFTGSQLGALPVAGSNVIEILINASGASATDLAVSTMAANAIFKMSCDYISSN